MAFEMGFIKTTDQPTSYHQSPTNRPNDHQPPTNQTPTKCTDHQATDHQPTEHRPVKNLRTRKNMNSYLT